MKALGQHICLRLANDRVIAPTQEERRVVARALLRIAESSPILGFGLADTHAHAEILGDESMAGEISRRMGCSLRRRLRLPVGFHLMPPRPVHDIWHLGRCFQYIHTQAAHHRVAWENWYEATSLPDLLGLRPRGAFLAKRMREHLPRTRVTDLLTWLGVTQLRAAHGTPEDVLDAALAASALPSMTGHTRETNALRRAVMVLTGGQLTRAELASLLGISVSTVGRLRSIPIDPELLHAVTLNLGLRQDLRS